MNSTDIDSKMIDVLIRSLDVSPAFHEYKLFFIHQHFDQLTITQMNDLMDILQHDLHHRDYTRNPILSHYNVIKLSLLYYRVSWKIEQKKIYSLITKCTNLKKYLLTSLEKFLSKQRNISQLLKLFREPVLHMNERLDSLDLMHEMDMD